jgi:hypothetical protein
MFVLKSLGVKLNIEICANLRPCQIGEEIAIHDKKTGQSQPTLLRLDRADLENLKSGGGISSFLDTSSNALGNIFGNMP